MDASSAFRGGIPVIFPQFGPGELPQHGFSRNSNEWVVDATTATEMEGTIPDESESSCRDHLILISRISLEVFHLIIMHTSKFLTASITLRLDDNEATRSIWPHRFSLYLTTSITSSPPCLIQTMKVVNRNDADPFHFTTALHSYFAVENVEQVAVSPLAGLTYKDKVKNGEKFNEKDEMVKIVGEVDRLYEKAPFSLTINEGGKPLISVVKVSLHAYLLILYYCSCFIFYYDAGGFFRCRCMEYWQGERAKDG